MGKITLADIKKLRERIYKESMALIETKGHDYNYKQQMGGDTLFNLRVAYILGVVDTPAKSVVVRMIDKMMRIISLTDADPEVKNESMEDTIKDLHNYADYWLIFKQEEKNGS